MSIRHRAQGTFVRRHRLDDAVARVVVWQLAGAVGGIHGEARQLGLQGLFEVFGVVHEDGVVTMTPDDAVIM